MQIVTSTTPGGILVRSASVPGRCYGSLSFGVGTRDEPVALAGVTHLVLHLVEAAMGPETVPFRAQLDENTLDFTTSGTLAQVTATLRRVAAVVGGLGSVGKGEIARQKHLMHVEAPGDYWVAGADALTYRFGLDDLGTSAFGYPTAEALTKKEVVAWAGAWLTAANAAVAITKPVTASFDLDLPEGIAPVRRVPVATAETPALLPWGLTGAAASLVVGAGEADVVGEVVRAALHERLVGDAGLTYRVDLGSIGIDALTTELTWQVEPLHDDLAETVRAIVLALRDFADGDIPESALAIAAEYARVGLGNEPESVRDWLIGANEAALRGFPVSTREGELAAVLAATPDSVAAVLVEALPSLVVGFNEHADLRKVAKKLDLPIVPFQALEPINEKQWKKATKDARVWVATKSGDMGGSSAVLTDGGLFYDQGDDGGKVRLLFADLALVGERPSGDLSLLTVDGAELAVEAGDWKQGKHFLKVLRAAVPAELVREFPGG